MFASFHQLFAIYLVDLLLLTQTLFKLACSGVMQVQKLRIPCPMGGEAEERGRGWKGRVVLGRGLLKFAVMFSFLEPLHPILQKGCLSFPRWDTADTEMKPRPQPTPGGSPRAIIVSKFPSFKACSSLR